jgi:hypothetical protein
MLGVADKIMTYFGEVLPDLVIAACLGSDFNKTVPGSGIPASNLDGKLDGIKSFKMGLCLLQHSTIIV